MIKCAELQSYCCKLEVYATKRALRAITGLDTLSASQLLGRLHHHHNLLIKGGAGSATYYELAMQDELPLFSIAHANTSDLASNTSDLPAELVEKIEALTSKARKEKLWPVIVWLCALRPYKADQLAHRLERRVSSLKTGHLNELREEEGLICYTHPEVPNHPEQAYQTTEEGRVWLQQQGIHIDAQ